MKFLRLILVFAMLVVLVAGAYFTSVALKEGDFVTTGSSVGIQRDDLFELSASGAMHWDHMPLTYNYGSCSETFERKIARDIDKTFEFYNEKTDGVLNFVKIPEDEEADITFNCAIGQGPRNLHYITEAQATPYVYTGTNVYSSGKIDIFASYDCLGDRPTLIIHEVGHLFGLDHNTHPSYEWDIMHPFVRDNCDADLLEKDIEFLKSIYGGLNENI